MFDRSGGRAREIVQGDVSGFGWSPDASEIFVSEQTDAGQSTISALSLDGRRRILWRGPGKVELQDVAADGTLLVTMSEEETGVLVQRDGTPTATDFGWLDNSIALDVSPSADALVLTTAFGDGGSYFVRKLDGSPAVRIGAGTGLAWSHVPGIPCSDASDGTRIYGPASTAGFCVARRSLTAIRKPTSNGVASATTCQRRPRPRRRQGGQSL